MDSARNPPPPLVDLIYIFFKLPLFTSFPIHPAAGPGTARSVHHTADPLPRQMMATTDSTVSYVTTTCVQSALCRLRRRTVNLGNLTATVWLDIFPCILILLIWHQFSLISHYLLVPEQVIIIDSSENQFVTIYLFKSQAATCPCILSCHWSNMAAVGILDLDITESGSVNYNL